MRRTARDDTMRFLDGLQEKEKQILLYRFSFLSGRRYTLKKIGDELGISPETVRQIEIRALKKLQDLLRGSEGVCLQLTLPRSDGCPADRGRASGSPSSSLPSCVSPCS